MSSVFSTTLRRLSIPTSRFDRLQFVGAVFGLLVVVHLSIMVDRGFDRGCFGFSDPTPTVECEIVVQSEAGTMFGVSNATWGLAYYSLLVALGLLIGAIAPDRSGIWRPARAVLLVVGLGYSAWLVYVQATQLGAYCKLCLISAGTIAVLCALLVAEIASSRKTTEN